MLKNARTLALALLAALILGGCFHKLPVSSASPVAAIQDSPRSFPPQYAAIVYFKPGSVVSDEVTPLMEQLYTKWQQCMSYYNTHCRVEVVGTAVVTEQPEHHALDYTGFIAGGRRENLRAALILAGLEAEYISMGGVWKIESGTPMAMAWVYVVEE